MPDEISALLEEMGASATTRRIGMRDYHQGLLRGQPCVVALTRVGKVAAAATTATLLHEFNVGQVVFTGLAGGVASNVQVGDVVVGSTLVQHDLDASPLFPRHEVPLLRTSRFATSDTLSALLMRCAAEFIADTQSAAAVHLGLIATGDQFLNSADHVARLNAELPEALCVEMEGAAVAQVCHEFGVPCAVLRVVSDRGDADSHIDFPIFLREVASVYSAGILRRFLDALPALRQTEIASFQA